MKPISHYKFCKAIALALIHPEQYWPDQMKTSTQDNNISVGDVTCIVASKWSCDSTMDSSSLSFKKMIDEQNTLPMHWVTSQSTINLPWGAHAQMSSKQSNEVCPSHVGQQNKSTINNSAL